MSYREYRFLGHEWGDLPKIFTSDEVMSENHGQIASQVTQDHYSRLWMYYFISYTLFYVLNAQFC